MTQFLQFPGDPDEDVHTPDPDVMGAAALDVLLVRRSPWPRSRGRFPTHDSDHLAGGGAQPAGHGAGNGFEPTT
jgi:hypothetical protein